MPDVWFYIWFYVYLDPKYLVHLLRCSAEGVGEGGNGTVLKPNFLFKCTGTSFVYVAEFCVRGGGGETIFCVICSYVLVQQYSYGQYFKYSFLYVFAPYMLVNGLAVSCLVSCLVFCLPGNAKWCSLQPML